VAGGSIFKTSPRAGSAGIHDSGAAQVKPDSLDGTHRDANSSGGSAILHYSYKEE